MIDLNTGNEINNHKLDMENEKNQLMHIKKKRNY